jgi:hypothetical protein
MITKSKQNWSIGSNVKVGFISGIVKDILQIVDYLPDIYIIERPNALYKFIPHNGIERITLAEYQELKGKAGIKV